jgi:uncharacterized protein DUF695/regulator of ribonuclease activity B
LSEDWDFYFARVNDAVASIFVDLSLKPYAPNEKRPWLLWVWVEMQAPRPDGLSSAEEAPKLFEIEESLKVMITMACGAQLVGRITGSNRREFYFYGEEPGELDEALQRAMASFPDYRFQSSSELQPEWQQYLDLLYPSATNLQRMMNRRVLEALEEKGDVHETPRPVDHWLKFADEAARAACRETLIAIEFAVVGEYRSEEPAADLPWSLQVVRVDSVDSHTINGITLELKRLAQEHGGDYDGWESPVTTANDSPPIH